MCPIDLFPLGRKHFCWWIDLEPYWHDIYTVAKVDTNSTLRLAVLHVGTPIVLVVEHNLAGLDQVAHGKKRLVQGREDLHINEVLGMILEPRQRTAGTKYFDGLPRSSRVARSSGCLQQRPTGCVAFGDTTRRST